MDIVSEGGGESLGFVRQRLEGRASTHVFVVFLETFFEVRGLGIHFDIDHGGFEAPDATQTPTGGYYVGDEVDFDRVGRRKIIEVVIQHFRELDRVFVLEDQGLGG